MADARLAEMISKMAHDLRSPLTSLKGFSGMLATKWDRFDDAQKLEFVEAISFDAGRMARIVTQVIDLARLEAGRLELKQTRKPVAEIARAAERTVAHVGGADRIEVDVPDDLIVHADPERLELVLSNLLENALEFSDEGAIVLAARSEDGSVVIEVRDSGPGIEAEQVSEIFVGAPSESGAGVGLYLGRGIIELHGGRLEVETAPGRGSVFTVALPRGADADE
jgi:signal transduction histidine kinase